MLNLPFQKLLIWQKGVEIAVEIHAMLRTFPKHEIYGLSSQMRSASVSIASNIAEGSQRGTNKEFTHFLRIAKGSLAELETQLEIAERIGYCNSEQSKALHIKIIEVSKMLGSFLRKISPVVAL